MSLWLELHVGMDVIGFAEIRRVTNTSRNPLGPDDVSEYVVEITDSDQTATAGTVTHRYGDGPWVLLRKALDSVLGQPGSPPVPDLL